MWRKQKLFQNLFQQAHLRSQVLAHCQLHLGIRLPHQKVTMVMSCRPYNSFVQIAAMKSRFPQFRVKQKGNLDILFTGELKVKDIFPTYTISIHYRGDTYPSVKIVKPSLVNDPPHFYK